MAKITNVAIQMDHVSSINIAGDSTFAMGLKLRRAATGCFTTRRTSCRCATAASMPKSSR